MGYNTKQGDLILKLMEKSNGEHMTADSIVESLKNDGFAVGKSTVYRHLEKLTKEGVVKRFVMHDGESACFQYVGDGCAKNHYHLKCSVCGKLFHVDCEYLDKVADHIFKHHGFILNEESTVLYGTCADCARKEKKNEEN